MKKLKTTKKQSKRSKSSASKLSQSWQLLPGDNSGEGCQSKFSVSGGECDENRYSKHRIPANIKWGETIVTYGPGGAE